MNLLRILSSMVTAFLMISLILLFFVLAGAMWYAKTIISEKAIKNKLHKAGYKLISIENTWDSFELPEENNFFDRSIVRDSFSGLPLSFKKITYAQNEQMFTNIVALQTFFFNCTVLFKNSLGSDTK